MKGKLIRRIIGILLSSLLLIGTFLLAATAVAAQTRGRRVVIVRPIRPIRFYDPWRRFDRLDRFRYSQYVFDNSEEANSEGYKEGLKTGQKDGKKEKSYDPERSHYYEEAGFGNFAEVYRSGFANGYRDGYGSRVG